MFRYCVLIVLLFFSLSSCKNGFGGDDSVLLEVCGESLFLKDALAAIPSGLSAEDSVKAIEKYKKEWATNVLLYEKAKENLKNAETIEMQVEAYRRSLTIYNYKLQLVKQSTKKPVSGIEIQAYYDENPDLFLASETMVNGFFLSVPSHNNDVKEFRRLVKTGYENMSEVESMCVKYGIAINHFSDKLKPLSQVSMEGMQIIDSKSFLDSHHFFEAKDAEMVHFLYVNSAVIQGETLPFEHVKSQIETMLTEQAKTLRLEKLASDLYEEACNNGLVVQKSNMK